MGIFSRLFGKKSMEDLNVDELRIMEIKLNHKIEEIRSEISVIDEEIQRLFEEARNAKSETEEVSIANRIKTLVDKKEMKAAAQSQLEKELRAVSNMLIIKEHEADLKSAGVWDVLKNVSPEKLERYLISKKLDAEDRNRLVSTVTEMTSMAIRGEHDELDGILRAIRAVKEGSMEPGRAKDIVVERRALREQ